MKDNMDDLLDSALAMLKKDAKASPFRVSAEMGEGSETVKVFVTGSPMNVAIGATAVVASADKRFKNDPILRALFRVMIESVFDEDFDDAKIMMSASDYVTQTPQGVADDNAMSNDLLMALLGKKKP